MSKMLKMAAAWLMGWCIIFTKFIFPYSILRMFMKTSIVNPNAVECKWIIIDAESERTVNFSDWASALREL